MSNPLFDFGDEGPNIANVTRLGYVGSTPTTLKADRDSDSWYTPMVYVESARAVMGGIDLDPFSSDLANETIKATRYHTEKNSCLAVDWHASSVWMNPPYGKLMTMAADKFLEQYAVKNFETGIILVNNSTDTKWFAKLAEHASAFCFTDHRIRFYVGDSKESSTGNTRGQVFIYFGRDVAKFKQEFAKHGLILTSA